MKRKLTLFHSLILLVGMLSVFFFGLFFARSSLLSLAEDNVISLTKAYTSGFNGDVTSLVVEDENVRETIIREDGTVLFDSQEDPAKMENHLQREEVQAALSGSPKIVIRSSSTMGVELLYYALTKTIDDSTYVVRISYQTSRVTQFMTGYIPWMVLVIIISLLLTILASLILSDRALAPLEKIQHNLDDISHGKRPQPILNQDEDIQKITDDINTISDSLFHNIDELKKESSTLELVLDSGSDAIVALSPEKEIVFFNKNFSRLFPLVKNTLPKEISDLFVSRPDRVKIQDTTYLVRINENSTLSLLVLTDITTQVDLEKERQEFFDASSHELKTPLTAIKGFNQLIGIKSEDPTIKSYSEKVDEETKRMLSVLTDMLQISRLENDTMEENLPTISLSSQVDEVFKELTPLTEKNQITLEKEGEIRLCVSCQDAYSLVKNLVENGILYNLKGGYVKVSMKDNTFVVSDNGIGIPEKDQGRIFERFYRVDKSRSREKGGTGLGLSIVKHIVLKYHARITLQSTPGYGSTFTVTFPESVYQGN